MNRNVGDIQTLEQFLRLPAFKPALEFSGGRLIQKMSPNLPHSILQGELYSRLVSVARPGKLGRAFLELRCLFGGEAQVPDISFFTRDRLPKCPPGDDDPVVTSPPDLAIEIRSPGQIVGELKIKLRFAIKHGSRLGWIIHPKLKKVWILRPRARAEILGLGDVLSGEDVLPGFALPLDELFGWLDEE